MTDSRAVILVNLRVVAKLQPGDRLQCTDSRYFGIDRGYMSFLWRWFKADGRALALERLEDIVREAVATRDCPSMPQLLADAAAGIHHLIETYHTDPTTVSRLEALLTNCQPEIERAL
jgi:hypothetical protein